MEERRNFDPRNPNDWRRAFGLPVTDEQQGVYGNLEDVEREAAPAVTAPVVARRGLRETWNGMSPADKVQTVATVAVLGVVCVEAAWLAREAVVPVAQNLADGVRTFVHNGTCGGGRFMETCGDTSFPNVVARVPGAIVDWLSMPVRMVREMRTGDGIPSMDATVKTIALGVEEYNFGAFRKTLGRGIVGGIRLLPAIVGAMRRPEPETKQ